MPRNLRNSVHIFLAHKGGVGKTTMAALLSEWILQQGVTPVVFDADAKNQTSCIAQYKALNAIRLADKLTVLDNAGREVITADGFERLLESVLLEDGPHVIDTGANTYTQWLSYMQELDLPAALNEAARTPYLHVIVSGGEMCEETVGGALEVARKLPNMKIVLWLNEHRDRAVMADGRDFLESVEFDAMKDSLLGIVSMGALGDVQRATLAKFGPLHLLSSQLKPDGQEVTMHRAMTYKGWARQAFKGLDVVFGAEPASATQAGSSVATA